MYKHKINIFLDIAWGNIRLSSWTWTNQMEILRILSKSIGFLINIDSSEYIDVRKSWDRKRDQSFNSEGTKATK